METTASTSKIKKSSLRRGGRRMMGSGIGRRTGLSFAELKIELDEPCRSRYPSCLLLNEVGELCNRGDKEAEAILRDTLTSADPNKRYIAHCFLSSTANTDAETILKLYEFRQCKENEGILKRSSASLRTG